MKEFDFDELDKAVNSLMGSVSSDQPTPTAAHELTTLTIPETSVSEASDVAEATSNENISSSNDQQQAAPISSLPSESPIIAPRKSGRFMDMVHAVGDPSKVTKAPSELPSRVSRTIVPSGGVPIADVTKSTTSEAAGHSSHSFVGSSGQETTAPADEPQTLEGEEPAKESQADDEPHARMLSSRGISLQPLSDNVVPEVIVTSNDEPSPTDQPDPLTLAESSEEPEVAPSFNEPQSSPFIIDAKVEKRPLGGSDVVTTPTVSTEVASIPLSEELNHDLMTIEAGESTITDAAHLSDRPSMPADHDVDIRSRQEDPIVGVDSTPFHTALSENTKPEALLEAGPLSIPQQYRETPSTGDQSNGSIYDTASYHQPLSHPAKKRSSWWIVLIIVLIIALGAGAGAFLYFQGYF